MTFKLMKILRHVSNPMNPHIFGSRVLQSLQVPLFLAVRIPGRRQHRNTMGQRLPGPASMRGDVKDSISALAAVNKTSRKRKRWSSTLATFRSRRCFNTDLCCGKQSRASKPPSAFIPCNENSCVQATLQHDGPPASSWSSFHESGRERFHLSSGSGEEDITEEETMVKHAGHLRLKVLLQFGFVLWKPKQ